MSRTLMLIGLAAGVTALAAGATVIQNLDAPPADAGYEWNAATPWPDRIILTWSQDPATTQSVTWRTDTTVTRPLAEVALATSAPGFVHLASQVQAETETLDARDVDMANVKVNYHSATFTGLIPDTLYAYRVGDGERWTEWFQFRTASAQPEPFAFLYFGDAQNDILSLWSRGIRQAYAQAPDARFIVHAGDLVNRAHADREWGEWFRAGGHIHAMVPSLPAPGNHEYRGLTEQDEEAGGEQLAVFWQPQYTLPLNGAAGLDPETTYFIDYQGVRVVVLNSDQDKQAQAAWLEKVLSDNPQKWTITTHHHPIFSSASDRDNAELRAAWKPIYDRHGVDLVLQGHDHTYARGRTRNVSDGVNLRDDETGVVYVVSVGGRKQYQFKPTRWDNYEAELDRRAENTQLFQVIRVAGDTLIFQAYTATGQLYDAFDLVKQDGRPNRFIDRTPATMTFSHTNTPAYRW
jgi:3',5'-cyclic AMP phosphodiesterase CpdA